MGIDVKRLRGAFGLGLCALALAACAENQAGGPSAGATSEAQTVQNVPQLANCTPSAQGKLYLDIGGTGVAVPQSEVRGVLTTSDDPANPPQTSLFERVASGVGCPSDPVATRDIRIASQSAHPMLSGLMSLSPGNRRALEGFADITRNLVNTRPEPSCRRAGDGVIDCRGDETLGSRKIKVLYLISTRPEHQTQLKGPITARCIIDGEQLVGCAFTDIIGDGVTFDAQLSSLEPNADQLAAAYAAALENAKTYLR